MMMTKIAMTAGEIWFELDRQDGLTLRELMARLTPRGPSEDLILMALGWLIYGQRVKYVPDKNNKNTGCLFIVSPSDREGRKNAEPTQDCFITERA